MGVQRQQRRGRELTGTKEKGPGQEEEAGPPGAGEVGAAAAGRSPDGGQAGAGAPVAEEADASAAAVAAAGALEEEAQSAPARSAEGPRRPGAALRFSREGEYCQTLRVLYKAL